MFWVGDQGEGTSPNCTLYFSDFRTSFSFSLWLGMIENETILPGALRHFKRYQTCMVTFLYTLYCMGFQWILGGEGRGKWWDRQYRVWIPQCAAPLDVTVTYARDSFVDSPSVLRPGWHMQETVLWIPRGAFCPLEGGGGRHIGTSLTSDKKKKYIYIYICREVVAKW